LNAFHSNITQTTSFPIIVSSIISESLGIDVLMKKYKHSVQLQQQGQGQGQGQGKTTISRTSRLDPEIKISGPCKKKKDAGAAAPPTSSPTIQQSSSNIEQNVSSTVKFKVGDSVEVNGNWRMKGSSWFPGTVNNLNDDNTYDILYRNGVEERFISGSFLRPVGSTNQQEMMDASMFLGM
jgi:hypothetical protein